MSKVVACHHCGAPCRLARGQSRYTCEWCGGENLGPEGSPPRELVVLPLPSAERAERQARRWAREHGWRTQELRVGEVEWTAVWQVVDEGGEEVRLPAHGEIFSLEAAIPPGEILPRDEADEDARPPAALVPRIDADQAVDAARARFRDPEGRVEERRLIWVAHRRVHLVTRDRAQEFRVTAGAGRIHASTAAEGAAEGEVHPVRVGAYAMYVLLIPLLLLAAGGPGTRAILAVFAFLLSWGLWSRLRWFRSGGRT